MVSNEAVIEETQDGPGTWRYTVPAGRAYVPGGALLPQSCVFVAPDEAGLTMTDMTTDCDGRPNRAHFAGTVGSPVSRCRIPGSCLR